MRVIRICTAAIARFLISAVFLAGAVNKILHWHEIEATLMMTLCDWQLFVSFSETAQNCLTTLTPWTPLILIGATGFELVGGLLILLGIKEKWGATLLILFLIPTTILFHSFWLVEEHERPLQIAHFLKNMAILGGLFLILLHGAQGNKSGGGIAGLPSIKIGH